MIAIISRNHVIRLPPSRRRMEFSVKKIFRQCCDPGEAFWNSRRVYHADRFPFPISQEASPLRTLLLETDDIPIG